MVAGLWFDTFSELKSTDDDPMPLAPANGSLVGEGERCFYTAVLCTAVACMLAPQSCFPDLRAGTTCGTPRCCPVHQTAHRGASWPPCLLQAGRADGLPANVFT